MAVIVRVEFRCRPKLDLIFDFGCRDRLHRLTMPRPRPSSVVVLGLFSSKSPAERLVYRGALSTIQCIRRFTTTPSPLAGAIKKSKFHRTRIQTEAKKLSDIPNDLGYLGIPLSIVLLIVEIMIPPTVKGSNLPSFFSKPRLRTQLLQLRYGLWDMNRTQYASIKS
jgi:hypothetical protein